MLNFELYQGEFQQKWAESAAFPLVESGFRRLNAFLKHYPALNLQNFILYPTWAGLGETPNLLLSLETLILSKFFDWLSQEVEPDLAKHWEPARANWLPVAEASLSRPVISEPSQKFLDYLEKVNLEAPDWSNWQSVGRYLANLRNRAFYHSLVWANLNTVALLELDRDPFDLWLAVAGCEHCMRYRPKANARVYVFRPASLERIKAYLTARDAQVHQPPKKPLFIAHSPAATKDARVSREMMWQEAKAVWLAIGYPMENVKSLKPKEFVYHAQEIGTL